MIKNEDERGHIEVVWTWHEERPGEHGKKMIEMELSGKRKRGKPKRKFLDLVKEDMGKIGMRKTDIGNRTLRLRTVEEHHMLWQPLIRGKG